MLIPTYTAENFLAAFQGLMPRGLAWPKDPDALQTRIVAGLTKIYARQSERTLNLLADAFPKTTFELLPEWEATLGLPDPCAGPSPTIQQRRGQVVARFSNSGGQSIPYFISYAKSLGYLVSTKEFAPFRAGQSRAGDMVGTEDWSFTWAIVAPLNTVVRFRAGQSTAGEPLGVWQNVVLECEMAEIKPAHTILQFIYQG